MKQEDNALKRILEDMNAHIFLTADFQRTTTASKIKIIRINMPTVGHKNEYDVVGYTRHIPPNHLVEVIG